MRVNLLGLQLVCVGAVLFCPTSAFAGGNEYPAAGTRALGRGGAFYARADDPMALAYNPANLARLSTPQLSLQVNQAFFDACMQRTVNYSAANQFFSEFDDPAADAFPGQTWTTNPAPEVCQESALGLSPNLIFTYKILHNLGIGVGLVAPAGVGITRWGDDDGTVTANGVRLPSPTRYSLVESNVAIAFPSVGVGYAPLPWLSFGATFHWGIGIFNFVNYTRASAGETPEGDIRSELDATDFFVPGFTASVNVTPHPNLNIMAGIRWYDSVRGSGETTTGWGQFGIGQPGVTGQPSSALNEDVFDTELEAPLATQLSFGIRYGHRIRRAPDATEEELSQEIRDPMSDELFDVEFDLVWEFNSAVDEFRITLPEGSETDLRFVDTNGIESSMVLPLPTTIRLPHNWKNQVSLRLGGDWNIIPGTLAARAGLSYETNGVNDAFAGLDFIPGERLGMHLGATVRLGRFDLSIAYAHIFQRDIVVTADEAELVQIVAAADNPGVDTPANDTINEGTTRVNFDVLSLGATYHF
ncbi:MAG: hypothetical protein AAGF12_29105 [Myxococcota bacterium]